VNATAWLDPAHVAAVVGPSPCVAPTQTRVVTLDTRSRRVVATSWLGGSVTNSVEAPGRLVLLLAPRGKIGAARLAVVDAAGHVRQKVLEAIPAGTRIANGRYVAEASKPGLAVDAAGGRAYVVPGRDEVAVVDLRTMRVDYHRLSERRVAKGTNGSERSALWLGNGRLAITGSDSINRTTDGHPDVGTTPAGLRIVDTRDWTFRTLEPQVSSVRLAGRFLLAQGSSYAYDGSRTTSTSTGVIAYSLTGRELYRLFDGLPVGRAVAIAGRGYATVGGATYENRTVSFDLATGTIGRTLTQPLWELLI
jgi:hypothetical protein